MSAVAATKFRVYRRCVCADVIVESLYCLVGWVSDNFGGCGLGETVNERVNNSHGCLGGRYWWDVVVRVLLL